ncbi:hypothetical protein P9057_07660 [Gallibacterium anatis]|uniref:hypothetical protein n=1 Tax=Gallibacterium anatis TaxID=750 RepID=UPI00300605E3
MLKPHIIIYRYIRQIYFRRKLKRYYLEEQNRLFNYATTNNLNHQNLKYDVLMLEEFRIFHRIEKGEMGILIREVFWMNTGIIFEWALPILEYYSDLDVLHFVFKDSIEIIDNINAQDEDHNFAMVLAENIIKNKLYLYVDYKKQVGKSNCLNYNH